MCSSQSLLRSCHIANLELLLWVVPTEENSEYHNIYDFNYVPLIYREFDKNDKEYPSTHFVMLNKDAMLKYCNIDYNALLDAVQHVPFSEDYSHSLNALLLEMLKAYDESKIVALSYYPLRLPSRFGLRILIHIQSIRLLFSTIFSPSNALAY